MTQHMPEPWEIAHDDTRPGILIKAGSCHIARVASGNPARDETNARSIAAAPDLLFAARAFMTALETMTSEDFSLGADKPFREQLSAAIARAKGE